MKPPKMRVCSDNIPVALWKGEQWVLWKWELRDDGKGGKAWTKPLFNAETGGYAKSNDSSTWTRFTKVWEAYNKPDSPWDGIGFVLNGDYVGIDWDDCVDPATGIIDPKVLQKVTRLNSYTEINPSGKGLKTLAKGKLPGKDRHNSHVGMFTKTRYFCITGNLLPDVSPKIESRPEEIAALYQEIFGPEEEKATPQEPVTETCKSKFSDAEILKRARGGKDDGAK